MSTKRGTISQGCKACGYHGSLESNHKLITFILKNPPNLNPATQGSSLTEGKRSKRSKKSNGEANGEAKEMGDSTVCADPNESTAETNFNDASITNSVSISVWCCVCKRKYYRFYILVHLSLLYLGSQGERGRRYGMGGGRFR